MVRWCCFGLYVPQLRKKNACPAPDFAKIVPLILSFASPWAFFSCRSTRDSIHLRFILDWSWFTFTSAQSHLNRHLNNKKLLFCHRGCTMNAVGYFYRTGSCHWAKLTFKTLAITGRRAILGIHPWKNTKITIILEHVTVSDYRGFCFLHDFESHTIVIYRDTVLQSWAKILAQGMPKQAPSGPVGAPVVPRVQLQPKGLRGSWQSSV